MRWRTRSQMTGKPDKSPIRCTTTNPSSLLTKHSCKPRGPSLDCGVRLKGRKPKRHALGEASHDGHTRVPHEDDRATCKPTRRMVPRVGSSPIGIGCEKQTLLANGDSALAGPSPRSGMDREQSPWSQRRDSLESGFPPTGEVIYGCQYRPYERTLCGTWQASHLG